MLLLKVHKKVTRKPGSVKEESETDSEEVVAEGKKLKEMGHADKSEGDYKSKGDAINAMVDKMKKMPAADVKELVAGYMKGDSKTDEEVEMEGLAKPKDD